MDNTLWLARADKTIHLKKVGGSTNQMKAVYLPEVYSIKRGSSALMDSGG
jgi:hypothetical protein